MHKIVQVSSLQGFKAPKCEQWSSEFKTGAKVQLSKPDDKVKGAEIELLTTTCEWSSRVGHVEQASWLRVSS